MKPAKPSPDFPLYPHGSGKWAKKIDGVTKYFGSWDDPQGALAEYRELLAKEVPPEAVSYGLTAADACNSFLTAKLQALESGRLAKRTYDTYLATCKRFLAFTGRETLVDTLTPQTFANYKAAREGKWNLVAVGNEVTRVRSMFKWLYESRLIASPMHFGPDFRQPQARTIRRYRRLRGKKLYEASEILAILDECGVHVRCFVLLGINCAFGPTDIATLPLSAVDLDNAWIRFPRPKTEADRECPLWPETVAALCASLARRPKPDASAEGRFFVMPGGRSWDNDHNPVSRRFRQAMMNAQIHRGGLYWLRHTFETIAGDSKDQVAVDAIMGHVDGSMAAVYRERIDPARLRAVVEHVRRWLFG